MAPSEGANQLHRMFSSFDDIINAANFEKIRTLGYFTKYNSRNIFKNILTQSNREGYLCVANMSIPISSGGTEIVKVAQQMINEIISLTRVLAVDPSLSLRVGISCGSLIGILLNYILNYILFYILYYILFLFYFNNYCLFSWSYRSYEMGTLYIYIYYYYKNLVYF